MNPKKIEKEFKKELLSFFSTQFTHPNSEWLATEVLKAVRKYIKQVIESVPMEEEDFDKVVDLISKENGGKKEYMAYEAGEDFCNGYNYHVQEIKQWKKKMLKELQEEK